MKIRKALVLEDEVVDAILLNRMLHRLGCQPLVVGNGQHGVEAFRREPFDFVVTDLAMPGMNGYEAARRMRTFERGLQSHVPIIALTAACEEVRKEWWRSASQRA